MRPPWFKVLDRYRRDGHFGLTPSFLVGAVRTPVGDVSSDQSSMEDLRRLLTSMRDETPPGFCVRLAECPSLHQPVAALLPSQSVVREAAGDAVIAPDAQGSTLYAWPRYFASEARTVESLVGGLWPTFGAAIRDGRFSWRRGEFHPFDSDDLAFVQRALHEEDTPDQEGA
jgi:hypothetical protein